MTTYPQVLFLLQKKLPTFVPKTWHIFRAYFSVIDCEQYGFKEFIDLINSFESKICDTSYFLSSYDNICFYDFRLIRYRMSKKTPISV